MTMPPNLVHGLNAYLSGISDAGPDYFSYSPDNRFVVVQSTGSFVDLSFIRPDILEGWSRVDVSTQERVYATIINSIPELAERKGIPEPAVVASTEVIVEEAPNEAEVVVPPAEEAPASAPA